MDKQEAPVPMSLTDQYRYESQFWKEQARELERKLRCHDGERRQYWSRMGEFETLLTSVGGIVEEVTNNCGNEAGLRKLVGLYKELQAKSAD